MKKNLTANQVAFRLKKFDRLLAERGVSCPHERSGGRRTISPKWIRWHNKTNHFNQCVYSLLELQRASN